MKKVIAGFALLGIITLMGCGGGNSGTTSIVAADGRVAVLLTDSFREDFAHIWATIYHVELVPQTGTPTVLFDDTAGKLIDLKTLRDASGQRFSFLSSATIASGTYTGLKVTVGATMQLFQNGVATGNPLPVDSSIARDTNGHPVIPVTFRTPKTLGTGTTNLIVDFDLAHFIIRNSKVIPVIVEGTETNLTNPRQHNDDEYHGTVSALTGTAPNLTFTLTQGNNTTVTVMTSASTTLSGSTGLANGSLVEVTGTLDPTTHNLVATQVEVPVLPAGGLGEHMRTPRICGTASSLNATAGTFTMTTTRARGFVPAQTTVNIVTSTTTVFLADNGNTLTKTDFFTALATTPNVAVEGTYDAASNTLTATRIKIEDHVLDGGWQNGPHAFRPGINRENWGHGLFR